MEAKQKAIRKAYGKYYDSQCDDFGWVRFRPQFKNDESWYDAFPLDISEPSPGVFRYRPQSLRGIEDNNGWIIIENESYLPVLDLEYKVGTMINDKFYISNGLYDKEELSTSFSESKITHYLPIQKPKPPIY